MVYGARVSLTVGIIAVSISLVIGLLLGGLAAYYSGFADSVIMRTADIFFAFPYILFAIALIAVLGPSYVNVFIAIGILGWPSIARVFRSSILTVKENEYVDAARAVGAGDARIMFRHIFPNSIAPIIVYGTMSIGAAILAEAALSFLGMGVQPPTPSWGLMLSEARARMVRAPWLMIWPGFAILTTVLAFVLVTGLKKPGWGWERGDAHHPDYVLERLCAESIDRFLEFVCNGRGAVESRRDS